MRADKKRPVKEILLSYHGGCHYNAVVPDGMRKAVASLKSDIGHTTDNSCKGSESGIHESFDECMSKCTSKLEQTSMSKKVYKCDNVYIYSSLPRAYSFRCHFNRSLSQYF
jgi:hypothetical protein